MTGPDDQQHYVGDFEVSTIKISTLLGMDRRGCATAIIRRSKSVRLRSASLTLGNHQASAGKDEMSHVDALYQ